MTPEEKILAEAKKLKPLIKKDGRAWTPESRKLVLDFMENKVAKSKVAIRTATAALGITESGFYSFLHSAGHKTPRVANPPSPKQKPKKKKVPPTAGEPAPATFLEEAAELKAFVKANRTGHRFTDEAKARVLDFLAKRPSQVKPADAMTILGLREGLYYAWRKSRPELAEPGAAAKAAPKESDSAIMEEAAALKATLEENRKGRFWPEEMKDKVMEFMIKRVATSDVPMRTAMFALGMTEGTFYTWLRESEKWSALYSTRQRETKAPGVGKPKRAYTRRSIPIKMRPLNSGPAASGLSVVTPEGFKITGLERDDAVALMLELVKMSQR